MSKSRFTEEQIVGGPREQDAGGIHGCAAGCVPGKYSV